VSTRFDLPAAHAWIVDEGTCTVGSVPRPLECCGWKNASTVCTMDDGPAAVPAGGCCGVCDQGSFGGDHPAAWRPPIDGRCAYSDGPPQQLSDRRLSSSYFDLSGEILRWVAAHTTASGGARWPAALRPKAALSAVAPSRLRNFSQAKHLPAGATLTDALLDEVGFVYVPAACEGVGGAAGCTGEIHLHYHPCGGSWRDVSSAYMLENALPQFAESNGFAVLYT